MLKLQHKGSNRSVWLVGPSMKVGSAKTCDLVVLGSGVANTHCQLFIDESNLLIVPIKDCDTFLNEIKVKELGKNETIQLLYGISSTFSDYHGLSYEEGVMEEIVALSGRYLATQQFPDKAIDLLDQASAEVRIKKNENKNRNKNKKSKKKQSGHHEIHSKKTS